MLHLNDSLVGSDKRNDKSRKMLWISKSLIFQALRHDHIVYENIIHPF